MSIIPIINNRKYKNQLTNPVIVEVNGQPTGYEITIPEVNHLVYRNSLSTDPIIVEMSGQGPQGIQGNGIKKIEKTSTSNLIDIYTIYYTNGDTSQFTVTNGKSGIEDIYVEDTTLIIPLKE